MGTTVTTLYHNRAVEISPKATNNRTRNHLCKATTPASSNVTSSPTLSHITSLLLPLQTRRCKTNLTTLYNSKSTKSKAVVATVPVNRIPPTNNNNNSRIPVRASKSTSRRTTTYSEINMTIGTLYLLYRKQDNHTTNTTQQSNHVKEQQFLYEKQSSQQQQQQQQQYAKKGGDMYGGSNNTNN